MTRPSHILRELQKMANSVCVHAAFYEDAQKQGKISVDEAAIYLARFMRHDLRIFSEANTRELEQLEADFQAEAGRKEIVKRLQWLMDAATRTVEGDLKGQPLDTWLRTQCHAFRRMTQDDLAIAKNRRRLKRT